MKNINKQSKLSIFIVFVFIFVSVIDVGTIIADDLDDFFNEDEGLVSLAHDTEVRSKSETSRFSSVSLDSFTGNQVLDVLRQAELVNNPLWVNTHFPRTRDALYLLPHQRMIRPKDGGISIQSYFNKTNQIVFPFVDLCSLALNKDKIEMILLLAGGSIAQACGLPEGTTIDADSLLNILPRLNNLSVEGRKSGLALQAFHKLGRLTLGFESALLLTERNAFASERIKQEVLDLMMDALGGGPLPPTDFDEVREFARIKIGLGDTRLSGGVHLIDRSDFYLNLGMSVILPTGNRGVLRDGRFKKPSELEGNNTLDFVVNPPRQLLLVPRLGHQGHFAVGCAAESKLTLFDGTIDIRARASYDHFISGIERRLVMFKKRLPPLEASVEQFRDQYLIPTEIDIRIYPGGIFTGLLGLDYHWGDFSFTAGYDFYLQQREDFGKIAEHCFEPSELKLPCAVQSLVEEHHATLAVHYKKSDGILFGIGGDWTFKATGSANSWTTFAQLSIPF